MLLSLVPRVISVEEVFRYAAAGLGDAVAVAVAQDFLHRRRPHRLPQARLVAGEGEGGREQPLMIFTRLTTDFIDQRNYYD